jgi:hypothetical protein
MDVDVAYQRLVETTERLHRWQEGDEDPAEPGEYYDIASTLAEAWTALDGWMKTGGFAPQAWRTNWPDVARKLRTAEGRREILQGGKPPADTSWVKTTEPLSGIDPVEPVCPYNFAHTRHWCGYEGCRDA